MSRTIPRAYVTAVWSKNRTIAEDEAKKYCNELVKAGFMPVCPVLSFSGIFDPGDPDAAKRLREMSIDDLKRARILVVCGDKRSPDVMEDVSIAKAAKVPYTTLKGITDLIDI